MRNVRISRTFFAIGMLLFLGATSIFPAEPVLSQLKVEQKIGKDDHGIYQVTPALQISFTLTEPADVTVTIARHLAGYEEFKWPYLAAPFPVRTLKPGKLKAGPQTVDWDGFDENGQPIVEVQNVRPDELDRLKLKTATVEQMTRTLPVTLLHVTVAAGKERLFANFDRAVETLRPNRSFRPFLMGAVDRQGNFLVPDFWGGASCATRPTGCCSGNGRRITAGVRVTSRVNVGMRERTARAMSSPSMARAFTATASTMAGKPRPGLNNRNIPRLKTRATCLERAIPNWEKPGFGEIQWIRYR